MLLLCEAGFAAPDPDKPPVDVLFAGTSPNRPEFPLVDVPAKEKSGVDLGGSDIVYTQTLGSGNLVNRSVQLVRGRKVQWRAELTLE